MRTYATPVVVAPALGGLLVGHVAIGNALAGLVQSRDGEGEQSLTAAVLGGGAAVHGGNASGLVCAALDEGGHALVRQLLEQAHTAAEAVSLLGTGGGAAGEGAELLVADALDALVVTVRASGQPDVRPAAVEELPGDAADPVASLHALVAQLRKREPEPREGHVAVAAMAALLVSGEPPRLHLALGPPCCAVFIRHWPGMELIPTEAAGPQGAVLARLAAAVAETTSTDAELRRSARSRLDRAEAEALREGEDAERMAALMDEHGDDRGAAVRRLVAQSHAAETAREALEELAVPPPAGPSAGARL